MTAAVSDFKPAASMEQKKKSGDSWSLDLVKTDDVLASLGEKKGKQLIVGFALETENEEANARAKLSKKRASCTPYSFRSPLAGGDAFAYSSARANASRALS